MKSLALAAVLLFAAIVVAQDKPPTITLEQRAKIYGAAEAKLIGFRANAAKSGRNMTPPGILIPTTRKPAVTMPQSQNS